MKAIDRYDIETVGDLYQLFGEEFPYACDLMVYFAWGNRETDNIFTKISRLKFTDGDYLSNDEQPLIIAYQYISNFMDCMEDLEEQVRELKLKNGRRLDEVY